MNFQEFKAAYMQEVEKKNVKRIHHPENEKIVILKYTERCRFGRKWNRVNMACRNLVVNEQTEEIVARGFTKFFSQRENRKFSTEYLDENYPYHKIEVTEKYDGIEALSYILNGELRFASDCSFISVPAKIANQIWNEKYKQVEHLVPENTTLVVEVIHPDVKVVTSYDFEDLILVGAVHTVTQHDYNYEELKELANTLGMKIPDKYEFTFEEAVSVAENSEYNFEGFVIRYGNDERIKVKNPKHVHVFKCIRVMERPHILKAWVNGELDGIIDSLPDEYKQSFMDYRDEFEEKKEAILQNVKATFEKAPKSTQKEFACWVIENVKEEFTGLMFALQKDKLSDKILKIAVSKQ
ncbi:MULTISPECIES: RNA ligase [Bacillus cereus group]|nr:MULTISPECIES: RNA ligase [Bacillus cereus group]